jgi:predicted ribosome quality control (RQC) complex YloA/Tae2 family protein
MNYKVEKIEIQDKEYDLYIGKNAKGNDEIIKICHPESLWFHLDNISSPHIILETNGDEIEKRFINKIAYRLVELKKNVPRHTNAIYTKLKNVKSTKTMGTVITKDTKIIKL